MHQQEPVFYRQEPDIEAIRGGEGLEFRYSTKHPVEALHPKTVELEGAPQKPHSGTLVKSELSRKEKPRASPIESPQHKIANVPHQYFLTISTVIV